MRLRVKPFTPEWVAALQHVPETAMAATITVVRPGAGQPTYDPETDTWTDPAGTTLYSGKARVQPIRSEVQRERPGDTTKVLAIRFSVPVSSINTSIQFHDVVTVTASPMNTTLLGYTYYVTDPVDSSNPLEKTFHAEINLEDVS